MFVLISLIPLAVVALILGGGWALDQLPAVRRWYDRTYAGPDDRPED